MPFSTCGLAGLDDGRSADDPPSAAGGGAARQPGRPSRRLCRSPPAPARCAARCSSAPRTRWLTGLHALGFSMVGGIAGAIAAIEAFKRFTGVTGSTGIVFAAPFAATVAVGRLGCFFAGLADFTYGTPTSLPWGVDFGDGIGRHPVQLYESLAMAAMFVVLLRSVRAPRPLLARQRLLSRGRLVWAAALRLGVLQALRNADRAVQPVPLGLSRPRPVRWRDDPPGEQAHVRRRSTQVGAVSLPRPDHVPLRDLPRAGAGQDRRGGRPHLLFQALPRARRDEDAGVRRSGLLAPHAGIPQARRPAAGAGHAHRARLPVGLRPLPRSRAALLPGDRRDQRGLQPRLPGVLRQFLAQAEQPSQPRRSRAHARRPGRRARASPTWCRSRAASRPSIPQILDDPRRRAAPSDPARDAEHQRHPHRRGSGLRRRAGRASGRASRSICSSIR